MIVFVNNQNSTIDLYSEKGKETYEFDEVDEMAEKIGKKLVVYVTQAMETTADKIVQTINEAIRAGVAANNDPLDAMDQQTYYLQSTQQGVLHVQDINVTFQGPGDCKQVDDEMATLIQESVILRSLMKKGIIKLVDYSTMKKSAKKQQRQKDKFQKIRQSSKDRDLDSIIIKTDRPGSAEMLASNMFTGGSSNDDVQTTDITDSIINDPTERMSPEQLNAALKSGKLAT